MEEQQDNYRPFRELNLSNARSENESYEKYRKRLKMNKQIMKLYNTIGLDAFKEMFPNGVHEAAAQSMEEAYNENNPPKEAVGPKIKGSLHLNK